MLYTSRNLQEMKKYFEEMASLYAGIADSYRLMALGYEQAANHLKLMEIGAKAAEDFWNQWISGFGMFFPKPPECQK